MGAPRRPWDDVFGAHCVLLCVLFYMDAVIVENKLRSIVTNISRQLFNLIAQHIG